MYFSFHCCLDLRVGGWVIGNPNIVRILKIRTQKWTIIYAICVRPLRLYNRFTTMDADRLNRAIFMYDKEKCSVNWNQKFKHILDDLMERWSRSQVIPLEVAKEKIAQKLLADWTHQCSTKPKMRTYVTFKDDINVSAHIRCNLPKYERSISQLRLGILPSTIETGRYANLKEDERICLLCQQNCVENEAHFLFECELSL